MLSIKNLIHKGVVAFEFRVSSHSPQPYSKHLRAIYYFEGFFFLQLDRHAWINWYLCMKDFFTYFIDLFTLSNQALCLSFASLVQLHLQHLEIFDHFLNSRWKIVSNCVALSPPKLLFHAMLLVPLVATQKLILLQLSAPYGNKSQRSPCAIAFTYYESKIASVDVPRTFTIVTSNNNRATCITWNTGCLGGFHSNVLGCLAIG